MTDLTQATATELFQLYQSGAVSPVAVAEQVLSKIERVNPVINAFCFVDPETTMIQAQDSEQRWQQNCPLGPLDGIPIAVKDSILTHGWPTLHASQAIDPDQSWAEDAPAVARLREAGAVFVGKTTMSEFGFNAHDSNSLLYGKVHNPWNLANSPGGSSGGSAVAVAAGLVPIALASDLGGSIAVPSAWCGVVGIKPSTGLVSQFPTDVLELTTVGLMARSCQDLSTGMNIISRSDWRDSTAFAGGSLVFDLNSPYTLKNKKIACLAPIDQSNNVVQYLIDQSAMIDFVQIDAGVATEVFAKLLDPKLLQQWSDIPESLRQKTGRKIQQLAVIAHKKEKTYSHLLDRHKLIAHMRRFMESYDLIICPATVDSADNANNIVSDVSPMSVFFCMTKQPTVTVPIGVDSDGAPMAIMIAGAVYKDHNLMCAAHMIQSAFPMPACPVIL